MGNTQNNKKEFKCHLIKKIRTHQITYEIVGITTKKNNTENDIKAQASENGIIQNFTLYSKKVNTNIKFVLPKDTKIRCTNINDYMNSGLTVTINIHNKKITELQDLMASYCPGFYCPLIIHFCNATGPNEICNCKYNILIAINGQGNLVDHRADCK